MSDITRQDLLTVMLFATHIAKLDSDFDPWEKKMLVRFAETIKLTDEERASLGKGGQSLGQSLQSISSGNALQLLIKMLCAVCYVDGTANKDELDFIEKVISKLGSPVFVLPREEWGEYEDEVFEILNSL